MDHLLSSSVTVTHQQDIVSHMVTVTQEKPIGAPLFGGHGEVIFGVIVAVAMVFFELQRRNHIPGAGDQRIRFRIDSCKRFLRDYWGETAGMTCLFAALLAFRLRGDVDTSVIDDATWEDIKAQWPLLMTADSLLSIQAMLRLTLFLSVLLRSGAARHDDMDASAMAAEPAALFLFGSIVRAMLLARTNVYMLDGPIGGWMPASCDVAGVFLLLPLGIHAMRTPRRFVAFTGLVLVCVGIAVRNHLALADDMTADVLFCLYHIFDLVAAFAHLLHTALNGGGVANGAWFVHLLLPVQQAMSAYYFVVAFEFSTGLVGRGKPFVLLQLGGVAQVGMMLAAAALYLSEALEGADSWRRTNTHITF